MPAMTVNSRADQAREEAYVVCDARTLSRSASSRLSHLVSSWPDLQEVAEALIYGENR